jgi:hypothetical protein
MSQNQEIIESKLCAYIDGELDPEGRAEIEKHLEANPQHRRLLESLRATRDLIRWLPREAAPPEVAETLSGQLERSVLLNYEGDSLRINFWPRLLAAAAIVLLTAGLGVAVFYALPRSQKPQLAMHTSPSEPNTGDVVPAPAGPDARTESNATLDTGHNVDHETLDRMKAGPDELRKDGSTADQKLADEAAKPEGVMARNGPANSKAKELDQLAEQFSQNPTAFLASAEGANNAIAQNAAAANYNAMVVLVHSNAPEQTERQLTRYLNQQQIQYRQPSMAQQLKGGLERQQGGWAYSNDTAKKAAIADKSELAQPPAAGPAQSSPVTTQSAQNDTYNQSLTALAVNQGAGGGAGGVRANNVYVCQMSRRQAEQLGDTLGNDAVPGNQVQNLNGFAYYNSLERGGGQNGFAAEQAPAQAAAQGGAFGERQRIMAKPSPATEPAGAMSFSIQANPERHSPTTQPAGTPSVALNSSRMAAGRVGQQFAETQPGSAPSDARQADPAASQPALGVAVATTVPADEPVNVFILVQPNNAPAAAGAAPPPPPPATQPSNDSLPQKAQAVPPEQPPPVK